MASLTARRANPQRLGTLADHLVELRRRLTVAAITCVAGCVAGWFMTGVVMNALRAPVQTIAESQHRNAALNYTDITGAFDLKLQIALTIGIVVSSPLWLHQLYGFIGPALTRRERAYVYGFFFSTVPLFFAGCAAGWYVLPHMVTLMTSFASPGDAAYIDAGAYYQFVLKLVLAIGVAFVVPVFLVVLNFVGVLTSRSILRAWRIALFVIVLFTAIATPSADLVSMFILAIPMIALFFAAVAVTAVHDRRLLRRT
jgi:sec-independent protein translocase protein TatC